MPDPPNEQGDDKDLQAVAICQNIFEVKSENFPHECNSSPKSNDAPDSLNQPVVAAPKADLTDNELLKKIGGVAKFTTFIENMMQATNQDPSQLDKFVESGLEILNLTGNLKSNEPLYNQILSYQISQEAFDEFYSGLLKQQLKKLCPNVRVMSQITKKINVLRDEIIY